MNRQHFTFDCEGQILACTLDYAAGSTALLMVTGGNETRAGAFSGQAQLAARIAAAGFPVLRFDRRGVGDSTGENTGFTGSGPDIAAAVRALHARVPGIEAIVGFGNCDAATALAIYAAPAFDALVLANPWTFDAVDEAPSPDAVRRRYADKLRNPREIMRLLSGGVSLSKLAGGLKRAMSRTPPPSTLAGQLQSALSASDTPVRYLLAGNDRTARAFMDALPDTVGHWHICEDAGHSFAEEHSGDWLFGQILSVLEEQARQLDMR